MRIRKDQIDALRAAMGPPLALRRALCSALEQAGLDARLANDTGDLILPGQFAGHARIRFDERGRPASVQTVEGREHRVYLDDALRPIAITDVTGHATTLAYDDYGAPTAVTDPAGLRYDFLYGHRQMLRQVRRSDGRRMQFEFTLAGELTRLVDPHDRIQRFEYNDLGKLRSFTNRLRATTSYNYHPDGRLAELITPTGAHWRFDDDGEGNRVVTFPDNRNVRFLFHGPTLCGLQRLDGQIVRLTTEPIGRVTSVMFPDGGKVQLAYDGDTRLVRADNGMHSVSLEYDPEGRLTSEQTDDRGIQYHYREDGLLGGLTTHRGDRWRFEYGADQRVAALSDATGRTFRLLHDARGGVTSIIFPNRTELRRTYAYSGVPVLDQLRTAVWQISRRYEYDAADLLTHVNDSASGSVVYKYDEEDQLLEVSTSTGRLEHAYDFDGNLTRYGRRFSTNRLNQLVRAGDTKFAYDSEGNCIERIERKRVTRFTYNSQNQLVRADISGGISAEYEYDGMGRRVLKRVGGVETRYTWCGQQLVGEDIDSPNPQRIDYLYIPGTYQLLGMIVNGVLFTYQTDHLGSPIRLLDEADNIVWSARSRGYSFEVLHSNVRQPFRFPGHYFDDETGLHYNVTRYYDPDTGRYLSTDPLWFQHGTNLYAYAANNPVRFIDPTGQVLPLLAIAAIVVAAAGVIAAGHSIASDLVNDRKVDWGKAAMAGGKTIVAGAIGVGIAAAALPAAATLAGAVAVGAAALAIGVAVNTIFAGIEAAAKGEDVIQSCEEAAIGVVPFQSQLRRDYEREEREGKLKSATGQRIVDGLTDVLNVGLMFIGVRLARGAVRAPSRALVEEPLIEPVEEKTAPRPAPMGPGEAALVDAVNKESTAPPAGMSKKKQGPFVAGVRDSVTGEISVRRNTGGSPENAHWIIRERIATERSLVDALQKMTPEERNSIRNLSDGQVREILEQRGIADKTAGMDNADAIRNVDLRRRFREELAQRAEEKAPGSGWDGIERTTAEDWNGLHDEAGSHAEVHALNDRLQAREGTDLAVTDPNQLREFQIDVARRGTNEAGPRCHHCENITSGTKPTERLGTADAQRDDSMGPTGN